MIRFEVSASDLRAQGLLRDRGYTENLEVARHHQNIAVWEGTAYFEELSGLLLKAGIPFVCCDYTRDAHFYKAFDGEEVQNIPDKWPPSFRFGAVAHRARARMAARGIERIDMITDERWPLTDPVTGKDAAPPLGLMPRYIFEERRRTALLEAMERYALAKRLIPLDWVHELRDLVRSLERDLVARTAGLGQNIADSGRE